MKRVTRQIGAWSKNPLDTPDKFGSDWHQMNFDPRSMLCSKQQTCISFARSVFYVRLYVDLQEDSLQYMADPIWHGWLQFTTAFFSHCPIHYRTWCTPIDGVNVRIGFIYWNDPLLLDRQAIYPCGWKGWVPFSWVTNKYATIDLLSQVIPNVLCHYVIKMTTLWLYVVIMT